jgi:hypothetical protein
MAAQARLNQLHRKLNAFEDDEHGTIRTAKALEFLPAHITEKDMADERKGIFGSAAAGSYIGAAAASTAPVGVRQPRTRLIAVVARSSRYRHAPTHAPSLQRTHPMIARHSINRAPPRENARWRCVARSDCTIAPRREIGETIYNINSATRCPQHRHLV